MLKIGDLSKISQVPVKTLRYYAEVGLLKPVQVDRFTGYRYYTFEQLTRLYCILALKDLGFSLEQIGGLLNQGLPIAELRGMLRMKQTELHEQIQAERTRLERVEARLKQIEEEPDMSRYDIVIKKVDPLLVASVRDIIPTYPEQGPLWSKLGAYLQKQGASPQGPCLTLYHSDEPEIDAEVCEQLAARLPAQGAVQVHELPAVEQMAAIVHHGPFVTIGDAYAALIQWIESSGYRICGPGREIYLREAAPMGNQSDPDTVTEIQFPVEKI